VVRRSEGGRQNRQRAERGKEKWTKPTTNREGAGYLKRIGKEKSEGEPKHTTVKQGAVESAGERTSKRSLQMRQVGSKERKTFHSYDERGSWGGTSL